jgi:hypothetical protein
MKPTGKTQTPKYCKLLYSKDFYTASNFYPKIFQLLKKSFFAMKASRET